MKIPSPTTSTRLLGWKAKNQRWIVVRYSLLSFIILDWPTKGNRYFHRAPRKSAGSHHSSTRLTGYRGGTRKGLNLTIGRIPLSLRLYSPNASFLSLTHLNCIMNLETNNSSVEAFCYDLYTNWDQTAMSFRGLLCSWITSLMSAVFPVYQILSKLNGQEILVDLFLGKMNLNDLRGFFFVQCPNHLQHLRAVGPPQRSSTSPPGSV